MSALDKELNSDKSSGKHPGKTRVPSILDKFALKGPNGEHQCFVTALACMSLSDAREASCGGLFQLPVARPIAAQLVQAVAFLHSRGIMHADIHFGNILSHLSIAIDDYSPDQFHTRYNEPYYEHIERIDNQLLPTGVPTHAIVPVWLGKASKSITHPEANILLTDFGESFKPSTTSRHYSNTPALSAPPEAHHQPHIPLSFPADIWSLACTIWGIIGAKPVFEQFAFPGNWMISEQVTALGKLPLQWWEKWDARSQWFNEDGKRINFRAQAVHGLSGLRVVYRSRDGMTRWRRLATRREML